MSKAEILAELARLSAKGLADVRASLDRLMADKKIHEVGMPTLGTPRIRSPRLADRKQSADFVKHVREIASDAAI
jgi:hypothetical protein